LLGQSERSSHRIGDPPMHWPIGLPAMHVKLTSPFCLRLQQKLPELGQ